MYEKQMELFNDGGLKDEGGMIDEVSGNDVPVGSTREEVRDDIPAMLSEGEFVFPADVVRYLGLNRLMQLRQEAKMGLKQMEAMGQMGNSEEAIIPDDLPFDVLEIMVMEEDDDDDEPQEKYQGGVLHAAKGTFVTPMFDPSNQDVRKYVNADGKTLMIPFLNGNPVYPVPTGYLPEGAAAEETPVGAPVATQSSGDNNPPPPPPQSEFQKAGGFGMDTSATDGKALATWIKEAEKVGTVGNVVAGIASAINPLIGGAIALANKKQKKDIITMLDEKIAQAQKTPIAGQVKALRDLKTRLTTTKGKGILSTVVSGIMDTISDAVGFGEEEKAKAKTVASTVAEQDPSESDDETAQAVKKSLRPTARTAEAQTAAEYAATKMAADDAAMQQMVAVKAAGTTMAADDAAMQQILAAKDEDTDTNQPVVSDSQLTDVGLDRFESDDARQTRAALGFSSPAVEPTEPDADALDLENAPALDLENAPAAVATAVDDVRNNIAALVTYGESLDLAKSSLEGFGEDPSSQAIKSYLEKAMDSVDTVVQSANEPTTTATTTAPVQGGGNDNDDGGVFSAPTSNVGDLQGMSTADQTAAVAAVTDNLSPTESTGGAELDTAIGISGLSRGGFAKRKKK